MKAPRPQNVTWLAIGVLSVTIVYAVRAALAIRQWAYLESLPLQVSPAYLLATGIVWSLVGLAITVGLWRGSSWASLAARIAAPTFGIYYWLERLILVSNPNEPYNRPFAITITLLSQILVFWMLSRPRAKAFFRRKQ